jgi:hypothetical protein
VNQGDEGEVGLRLALSDDKNSRPKFTMSAIFKTTNFHMTTAISAGPVRIEFDEARMRMGICLLPTRARQDKL